ncbi:hypothetical protein Q8A67_001694 [Cirrhinus molitorella]|uniref:Ig-like domain-containing protein n=1 Tax=Cirrhinus molitorella TaxID=172907 RepID=A0AA88QG64_9TELE|nr:hypothetical protein Q8A67_001694 [Cirrhinus molitorella]
MMSGALPLILLMMSFIYSGLTQGAAAETTDGKDEKDSASAAAETTNDNDKTDSSITLTCDIQRGENIQWTYSWFKDDLVIRDITERDYTITSVSDSGEYSCRGQRSDSQRSDISAAVTLTVSVKPTVSPDQHVFRGETVTLTCDIQGEGNIQWTYRWFKDGSVIPTVTERFYTITSEESDRGKYSCEAKRSDTSAAVSLTVSDLPTSTLTVTPTNPVFTGETVSMKCKIESEHSNWRYEWTYQQYTDSRYSVLQTSGRYTVNRDTLTIKPSETSDSTQYRCRGHIDGRSVSSYLSSAVSLFVKDLPTSTLTVTPTNPVFTGETVSMKCKIESEHSNWRYEWTYQQYTDSRYSVLQTSGRYTVNRDTLTIKPSETSDSTQYRCRGHIDGRSVSSQLSSAVSLFVKDLPTSTLTVTPTNPVFTGETVSMKCKIESEHSNWRYEWEYQQYTDSRYSELQTSERYTVNRDTLTIKPSKTSDSSQYWCRGHIDGRSVSSYWSSAVSLFVKDLPTSTLTLTLTNPVFTGETVSMKCKIESEHSNWRYEWTYQQYTGRRYSVLQTSGRYTVNRDTLTIRGATKSDQGQYKCKGQRNERPKSSQSSSAISLIMMDLPTSTLTVTPTNPVFTGETVNMKCKIESDHSNWRYEWTYRQYTDSRYSVLQTSERYTVNRDTLTIKPSETSDGGQYRCRGHIDGRSVSSYLSSAVSLFVKDLPTSTLTVTPTNPVFTGETVSMKCKIESDHSNWRYEWTYQQYTGRRYSVLQTSGRYTVNRDTLTIRGATKSDQGQYKCKGQRNERPNSSQSSSAISLIMMDLPTSTLTVTSLNPVFTGETVSMKCEIKSDHSNWRYEWTYRQYTDSRYSVLQTSERNTVNGDTLTIKPSKTSDGGQYWCQGHIDGRSVSSKFSSAVSLFVKDLPTSTLTVTPTNPVFTGETVSMTCKIESDHSNWRYEWTYWQYTDSRYSVLQTSGRYTVNGDTLTIQLSDTSDDGQYWCGGHIDGRSVSSQSSSIFSLFVKDLPTSTLNVIPDSPVFTGETVNLTCVIESNHSDWRYEWYKGTNNSVMVQTSDRNTVNRDTLTIRRVNESDQDQYWCRGQRDGRPKSSQKSNQINLSVNVSAASSSSLLVTAVVVGLSVFLLFFISLVLLWRYKKNKDQPRNLNQTSVPSRSAEFQPENSPLQSGCDHVYDDVATVKSRDKGSDYVHDDVTVKKNGDKDDRKPFSDVIYSDVTVKKKMDKDYTIAETNNVTYSEVGKGGKKCKSKDINITEPSDLTYAQINTQDKKNTKGKGAGLADIMIEMKSKQKNRGKSSESGDTFYSEVRHNTDKDADAGVDATYAQPIRKKNKTHADAEVNDATYAQPIRKKNKPRP